MCEPTTILAATTTALRSGNQVAGRLARGASASATATGARRAARAERRAASAREETARQEARRVLGDATARQSASGVRVDTGSSLDAQAALAQALERDILRDRTAGETRARAQENRAAQARFAARQSRLSAGLGAAATLLNLGEDLGGPLGEPRAEGGTLTVPNAAELFG